MNVLGFSVSPDFNKTFKHDCSFCLFVLLLTMGIVAAQQLVRTGET